jgi:hypothetical protein
MGTPSLGAIRNKLNEMGHVPLEVSVVRQVQASQNAKRHFGMSEEIAKRKEHLDE